MGLIAIISSAVLYSAANYSGNLYFLNWIFLIPFLYYLFITKKSKTSSLARGFINGWLLGFFILLFSTNFLYHSIRLYTAVHPIAAVFLLLILFLILSLVYGIFVFLYLYLVKKIDLKDEFNPYLFTFSWLIFEWIRYYFISFFPLTNPAYSQAEFLQFIQLAEYGGIWILTFILILANALIFEIILKKRYKNGFVLILILLVIFANAHYKLERQMINNNDQINIGIITTQIKQQNKWKTEQLEENNKILLAASKPLNQAQLIIAPETNITFDFYNNNYYRDDLTKKIKDQISVPLQIGSLAANNLVSGRFNSSFLLSPDGKILARYNKNLLLCFGEKFPYENLLNKYIPYNFTSLNPGNKITYFKTKNLKWKTVICSEILYPQYVKVRDKNIDFIVNQTNEAWFADSILVKNIMWQAAVFRAVENRIPVVKTGNQAYNGIIYASGEYQKVDSTVNYHILKSNKE
jgi:apolipoprotein N-acyltransferase